MAMRCPGPLRADRTRPTRGSRGGSHGDPMIHRSDYWPFGEEIGPTLDPNEGHRFTAHWREYRGTYAEYSAEFGYWSMDEKSEKLIGDCKDLLMVGGMAAHEVSPEHFSPAGIQQKAGEPIDPVLPPPGGWGTYCTGEWHRVFIYCSVRPQCCYLARIAVNDERSNDLCWGCCEHTDCEPTCLANLPWYCVVGLDGRECSDMPYRAE